MEVARDGGDPVPVALVLPAFASVLLLGQVLSQAQAVGAESEPMGQGEGLPGITPLAVVTNWDALGSQ